MYRDEFPITKSYVYLDHAGVAPVPLRVEKVVERFIKEASEAGLANYRSWMDRVEEIRRNCAKLINADVEEIAFVKNTSHGLSIVAEGLDWQKGDNLLVYEKEFPANVYPWLNLQRKGIEIKFVPSRGGKIMIEDIERLIDSKTKLLTISSVQFSNGFKIDLKNVGELCRKKGVLLCVDAIQSLGVLPMNVREFHVDFLAADGHKWLLSTEGTGIFYCRKALAEKLNPPLIGWKSIQHEYDFDHIDFRLKTNALRFEEGSLNIVGIYALGASIDLLLEVGIQRIESKVLELGDLIIREAEKRNFKVKTPKGIEERGGIVSIAGNFNPIDVKNKIRELGIIVNVRGGAIRISPHFYNTEEEVVRFFDAIDKVLKSKKI
jgi:selenocysteine lyase/cysteine desulfurase